MEIIVTSPMVPVYPVKSPPAIEKLKNFASEMQANYWVNDDLCLEMWVKYGSNEDTWSEMRANYWATNVNFDSFVSTLTTLIPQISQKDDIINNTSLRLIMLILL